MKISWHSADRRDTRIRKLIKTLGGLYACKNIDEIVLGRTEVSLTEKRKTRESNSKITFFMYN